MLRTSAIDICVSAVYAGLGNAWPNISLLCNFISIPPTLDVSFLKETLESTWATPVDVDANWSLESFGLGSIIISSRRVDVAVFRWRCPTIISSIDTSVLFTNSIIL